MAMAQGIWLSLFPDSENTENLDNMEFSKLP